jgi:lipopolysaccharide transport system permease protein
VAFVDFLISFILLLTMMAWYRFVPGWQIIFLPLFILFAALASIGPALWVTALNVKYRDFRLVIPFIIQFGLYVSPVGFSSQVVPAQWQLLYSLNPMVAVIDGFRWSLLGGQSNLSLANLSVSATIAISFLWFGIRHFRKTEASFADLI